MQRRRAAAPLERDIQASIIDYLRLRGWLVLRINAGLTVLDDGTARRRVLRGAPAGTPDVFAVKDGVPLFVEVKRPGNKPTDTQRMVMADLAAHGASCLVATSVEDVRRAGV